MKNKKVKIPLNAIRIISIGYVSIPVIIFLLSWCRLLIGIPAVLLLGIALYRYLLHSSEPKSDDVCISLSLLIIILVMLFIWCWTTGVGNFFVNSYDHPWRTAILRDMINNKWPVIYPQKVALVYYLFFWLVPALFGKLFGWGAACVVLLLWLYIGTVITSLLLISVIHVEEGEKILIAIIIFIAWSGLNTVGAAICQVDQINPSAYHLNSGLGYVDNLWNGYSFNFLLRNNYDALTQIYNQITPLWILTLLWYEGRKKPEHFALLGLLMLPYAPIPFIGILFLMVCSYVHFVVQSIKQKKITGILKPFSFVNILAAISIFPIIGSYYFSNTTTSSDSGGGILLIPFSAFDRVRWKALIIFELCNFILFLVILFRKHKKNYLFYCVGIYLIFTPLVEFGRHGGRDFCMNGGLVPFFVLMIWVVEYVCQDIIGQKLTVKRIIVIACLVMMCLSPAKDFCNRLEQIQVSNQFPLVNDSIYTLEGKPVKDYSNFLVKNYDKSIFYKYIAK